MLNHASPSSYQIPVRSFPLLLFIFMLPLSLFGMHDKGRSLQSGTAGSGTASGVAPMEVDSLTGAPEGVSATKEKLEPSPTNILKKFDEFKGLSSTEIHIKRLRVDGNNNKGIFKVKAKASGTAFTSFIIKVVALNPKRGCSEFQMLSDLKDGFLPQVRSSIGDEGFSTLPQFSAIVSWSQDQNFCYGLFKEEPGPTLARYLVSWLAQKVSLDELRGVFGVAGTRIGAMHARLATSSNLESKEFKTLLHGDLSPTNVIFSPETKSVSLIDLSAMSYGTDLYGELSELFLGDLKDIVYVTDTPYKLFTSNEHTLMQAARNPKKEMLISFLKVASPDFLGRHLTAMSVAVRGFVGSYSAEFQQPARAQIRKMFSQFCKWTTLLLLDKQARSNPKNGEALKSMNQIMNTPFDLPSDLTSPFLRHFPDLKACVEGSF